MEDPQNCPRGYECEFDGCCMFVHPGEQGTFRKYIPEHTFTTDKGTQIWLPARTMLMDSYDNPADYHERLRKEMSWVEWKAYTRGIGDKDILNLMKKRVSLFTPEHNELIANILVLSLHTAEQVEVLYSWAKAYTLIRDALDLIRTFPPAFHSMLRVNPDKSYV